MKKGSSNFRRWMMGIFIPILFSFFVSPAFAVVTAAQYGSTVNDSSDGTSYAGPTGTPSANQTLVTFVSATGTVAAATMTGGGFTWTKETSVLYNTTSTLYVFWANTGASPGATNILFDCTGDSATGANIVTIAFSGTDVVTLDPIKQFKTSSSASSTPATTMDAAFTVTNGGAYAVGMPRSPPALGAPVPWTEVSDLGHSSPTDGMETAYVIGETASTITTTGTALANGMIVVEIYASGAGPAPPTVTTHTLGAQGVGN